MRSSFHPRLINPPFDDPGLFVRLLFSKRAFLFDLGDLRALSNRDLLKVSHAFVSHTHVDHFIGFDHLLRLHLGREKTLHLFGPPGFLANLRGKLSGYTWNLVDNYPGKLLIRATEIHPDHRLTQSYHCDSRFAPDAPPETAPAYDCCYRESALTVHALPLDHDIPCLGFRLAENFHVNVRKDRLDEMGLTVGPWISRFKAALFEGKTADTPVTADAKNGPVTLPLGELSERTALITPGQIIAYVTDVRFTGENAEKILRLAKDADHLFIEAPFLHEDAAMADQKRHLTARQAGMLAGMAGAKQFTIFHFSPRYEDAEARLYAEADVAYADYFPKPYDRRSG